MTSDLLVVVALRTEHAALRGRVGGARLERCGMGPDRVRRWLRSRGEVELPGAVVVAGVAGGLDPSLRPGDVVVASEVRDAHGSTALPARAPLVAELRRLGLRVHHGPVLTRDRVVGGQDERATLFATGAIAVDMESAPIARHAADRGVPVAVVRVVVDTAATPVLRPATITSGVRALHTLRRLGPVLSSVTFTLPKGVVG